MKGFSATVETGTEPDKIAGLKLENGEVISIYDGKMRLEGANGDSFKVKCIASVERLNVENEEMQINDEEGIRAEGGSTIVVGRVTDIDARSKWMDSRGKPLTEVYTGIGQVALKRDMVPAKNYKIEEGDKIKAFCNRFTLVGADRQL